jgi:hypothetical protein
MPVRPSPLELPWLFRCCGDEAFVYLPGFGYINPFGGFAVPAAMGGMLVLGLMSALLVRKGARTAGPRWAVALAVVAALIAPTVRTNALDVALGAAEAVAKTVDADAAKIVTETRTGMDNNHVMNMVHAQSVAYFSEASASNLTYTPIISRGVLSAEEAAGVMRSLYSWRARWDHRSEIGGPTPFFTFGAATYLDATSGEGDEEGDAYREKVQKQNPFLEKELGWMYERVRERIGRELGAPARYHAQLQDEEARDDEPPIPALPGFHIMLPNMLFQLPVGRAHRDNNHENDVHDFPPGADARHTVSFTLALDLPRRPDGEGAPARGAERDPDVPGLYTFQLEHPGKEEGVTFSKHEGAYEDAQKENKTGVFYRVHHPYEVGAMHIHSGHLVHKAAIAPRGWYYNSDTRVTLQGFGIFDAKEREWIIIF